MNFEGVSACVLSHNETLKNTPQVWEMYKGIRKRKRENLQDLISN
jgi:hypothetical protein